MDYDSPLTFKELMIGILQFLGGLAAIALFSGWVALAMSGVGGALIAFFVIPSIFMGIDQWLSDDKGSKK